MVTVVYGVDPLCGWCFGIGEALRAARRELADEVQWEVALGGLVVGERVRPVAEDAAYLRQGLAQVERTTGRRAGPSYWREVVEPGTWISDSEPAVRAVVAVRDLAGDDAALDVAYALCDGMYLDGRTPDDPAHVRQVAADRGLDADAVLDRFSSADGRTAVQREYARARGLGITTYPSLFVRRGAALIPVVAGYAPTEAIVEGIRAAAP